ncbi:MAG: YecA family protein [Alteromonadaceae bacterium]|uniref:YecA/YgfB family protein n=1 Tax=unclassified Marinobacter TaxID=83889 RepID=UPI000C46A9B0|nr:YecA family protein [Marinobacter sp. BGYM27]MAA64367.1 YecA family protein [Alteromonadaceae bacterium]MBH85991.1 YecA family protein [Alteromonadaceae bacterium]MDG5498780.1 YecA family protein [Marinobacter sp. BGYM27]|tara:strand:+ start:71 stop:610 length:540 start_codon:yes stop_codon:yes gene_type:complete
MLSPQEIEAVEDILFAEPWGEDALDFFGLHGVVSASVVGPTLLDAKAIFLISTGLDELPEGGVPDAFDNAVSKLADDMTQLLNMGEAIELPEPEDGDPMNALENWCAGFVDTFLQNEDAWLESDEKEAADLLVPMLALSGLFEDEDFEKVRNSETLSQQMADAIPDSLTDLYLLFHVPG